MLQAPAGDRFPPCPATWYLFGAARELRRGPVSKAMLGRRLVAFRTAAGRYAVLDARCAHLGADLGRGCVVAEALRCPFHHWEYDANGRCRHIPGAADVPAFARQTSYPVEERHGFLFFFNGPQPLFPLPFFADCRPEDFVAGRPFRFIADCAWYLLAANGFDAAHFQAVHDRTLTGPATVDCPHPLARRVRYHARVTGHSVYDRLLRRFAGGLVEVSITTWAGPFILVTGFFRRACSYLLIAGQPLGPRQSLVEVLVYAPRCRGRLAQALLAPLGLEVRRAFTRGFLRDDLDRLAGICYNPHTLIEADRLLIEYFAWVADLPQGPSRAARPVAAGDPVPVNAVSAVGMK
jgi:nitrite reductase/ring-hydroxylating ferredoxin subunit